MNLLLRRTLPVLLGFLMLGGSAMAQGRIATIDLKRVFDNYWKTKQASASLDDRKKSMEKEDKNMLEDHKKAKADYDNLQAAADDQNISPEEREKRKRAATDKLKQVKDLEETILAYERQARTTLLEQNQRMRNNILGEIKSVVGGLAKKNGYSLVIDIAAQSADATPIILYTGNENDITENILADLNRTAPAESSTTATTTTNQSGKK